MNDQLSDKDYREKLTPIQYHLLREKGTEPPFSGKLVNNHASGDYCCAACGQVVFSSKTKFDSHSGWPSFYETKNKEAVKLKEDNSLGMQRIEVSCANCGSHLGHMFDDAYDQPGGKRYCVNSGALDFHRLDKEE